MIPMFSSFAEGPGERDGSVHAMRYYDKCGSVRLNLLHSNGTCCFMCEDALALYREFKSRGVQTRKRPFVGNHLWVVPVTDPDGYRMEFESPTDAPEESELEE